MTDYERALKDHILIEDPFNSLGPEEDQLRLQAFYLKKKDEGRMGSTLLIFTPEGIVITGDLTPERNGSISTFGYGLGWFASDLDGSYLCEKFLTTRWIPEIACEDLKEYRNEEGINQKRLEALIEHTEALHLSHYEFHAALDDVEIYDEEYEIGIGYDPAEAGWLCAIQKRFAELWSEKVKI